MKKTIIAILVVFALLLTTGMAAADVAFDSKIKVDSGSLSQTARIDGIVKNEITMSGNGLRLSTHAGVGMDSFNAMYATEAYAANGRIKDKFVVKIPQGPVLFRDVTKVSGMKIGMDKVVLAGMNGAPDGSFGATYYTKAYSYNRDVIAGWNVIDKQTMIMNPMNGDRLTQKLLFQSKACGSYEPDNLKLETTIGLGEFGLLVQNQGHAQGDIARYQGQLKFSPQYGPVVVINQNGYAAPGRVDLVALNFLADLDMYI